MEDPNDPPCYRVSCWPHPRSSHGTKFGSSCRDCLAIAKPIPVAVQVVAVCEGFFSKKDQEELDYVYDHGQSYRDY